MRKESIRLPQFLQQVDHQIAGFSHESMRAFIHEVARTWPENERDRFLRLLDEYGSSDNDANLNEEEKEEANKCGNQILIAEIEEIREILIEMNDGECVLDSEYNIEWDEWYNNDVPEVLFSDPQGILNCLNRAMEMVHSCIDTEIYEAGFELAKILSVLEIFVEGAYAESTDSVLKLYELEENHLMKYDFREFTKECLYVTYMANQLSDRADTLFCMMENLNCCEITLEEIMQMGNCELPEFDEFLMLWIDYLGNQSGFRSEKLLLEAQSMLSDEDLQIEAAENYVELHPVLYEQLLRGAMESGEDEKMFRLGKEAMEKIPVFLVVRSDIALLTAVYAFRLQKIEEQEHCYLEAFRSNSTVVNYMRIRFGSRDWGSFRDEVTSIFEQNYNETRNAGRGALRFEGSQKRNCLHNKEYCMMLFWNGEFEKMFAVGMNMQSALGWSGTFMKEGLSLMLLAMYQGESLPKELSVMCDRVEGACGFTCKEYDRGTDQTTNSGDRETFWAIFCRWKQENPLRSEIMMEWLERIDHLISVRVTGIMEKNHRNYYGECAAFIAAFGEVQESLGIPGAKAQIMERYRSAYSRRSAFHQELRAFGMKK
ncbi:MAG: hypothetical protein MR332_00185 [Fusicatenibacter sp.]|nr:hypothetical protein [Fusicatenibacter sp.]